MSTFKALAACLCLGAALGAADFNSLRRGGGSQSFRDQGDEMALKRAHQRLQDSEELRAAIDETQALFDALALVSGPLDEAAHKALYKDLRMGYKLPDAESDAAEALGFAEEAVKLKAGIKGQQARLAAAGTEAEKDVEESRLLGLQSDLMGLLEDLRKRLRSLHKALKEDQLRDLRNWAMVSEGVLRRQQEEQAVKDAAQKAAEALPIDAGAVEALEMSATAGTAPEAPTPTAKKKDHGKPR